MAHGTLLESFVNGLEGTFKKKVDLMPVDDQGRHKEQRISQRTKQQPQGSSAKANLLPDTSI
jgi:hypothetical protein